MVDMEYSDHFISSLCLTELALIDHEIHSNSIMVMIQLFFFYDFGKIKKKLKINDKTYLTQKFG